MSISPDLAPRVPADGRNHDAPPNYTSVREMSSWTMALWGGQSAHPVLLIGTALHGNNGLVIMMS
jgi:hypothetical protein